MQEETEPGCHLQLNTENEPRESLAFAMNINVIRLSFFPVISDEAHYGGERERR